MIQIGTMICLKDNGKAENIPIYVPDNPFTQERKERMTQAVASAFATMLREERKENHHVNAV